MSKKILSIALVVVMLVSTFALTAFAASGPLDSIGIKVVTSATTNTKAGDPVEVKVYLTVPDGADLTEYLHNKTNIVLSYTDAYTLNSAGAGTKDASDARIYGDSYAHVFDSSKTVNNLATFHTTTANSYNANDTAKNWTDTVYVAQVLASGYGSTTGYEIDVDCELFTLNFVAARDFTENDSIGVPEGTVGGNTNATYITTAGRNAKYDASQIDISEAVAYPAAPAAEAKVEHVKTMGQMSNWTDATATTFNAGLVGRISNLEIEFDDEDECTTVTDIIVSITYGEGDNETTLTGNAYQLYEQADGSYLFRAVVRGAKIADTTEFSYKYIVTLSDGSKLTYESTQNTSFSAIYNTAKANYDAANPAA